MLTMQLIINNPYKKSVVLVRYRVADSTKSVPVFEENSSREVGWDPNACAFFPTGQEEEKTRGIRPLFVKL